MDHRATSRPRAWTIGSLAALAFLALTCVRLGAQGPQYDELHQAPAAFTHLGSPPELFSLLNVGGYPLLNTTYTGAVKSHLFGLYLRLRGRFALVEWRLFGILLVASALIAFAALAAPTLQPLALALLLGLLVTDGNVLLLGRHDFGPADIALALRLLLIALWLRGNAEAEPPPSRTAILGVLVGFAVFEKLSSVVLVPVLALMVASRPATRDRRHLLAAACGLLVGALPLALVNLASLLVRGELVSLSAVQLAQATRAQALSDVVAGGLGLGAGGAAGQVILGLPAPHWLVTGEAVFTLLALLAALALARPPRGELAPAAGTLAVSYALVMTGLYLLPQRTAAHHWILLAPFQYAALAAAVAAVPRLPPRRSLRRLGTAMSALGIAWLCWRAPTVWRIEHALAAGRYGRGFDPAITALGHFAAGHRRDAVFIATDWGVATQIYCLANGEPRLVWEPFWRYHGAEELRSIARRSGRRIVYLVRLEPAVLQPGLAERIERDALGLAGWHETAVEAEARWPTIHLRRFEIEAGPGTNFAQFARSRASAAPQ